MIPNPIHKALSIFRSSNARFLPSVEEIVSFLADAVEPKDVVVVMSNGAFGGLHERLLRALEARTASAESR